MKKIIIPEPILFEWDSGNIEKNVLKHSVSNKESEQVFFNQPLVINDDDKHSTKETRITCLGITNKKRLLFISFTIRNNKVRIISTRDMSHQEKKQYEKIKANTKI